MFYTLPSAELSLPFLSEGEKSWSWLEIALRIPMFLVTLRTKIHSPNEEEMIIVKDLLLSRVEQVLDVFSQQNDTIEVVHIQLLSPGYMNKNQKDGYQLGKIKQIWRHSDSSGHTFILSDGEKLSWRCSRSKKMDLILNID